MIQYQSFVDSTVTAGLEVERILDSAKEGFAQAKQYIDSLTKAPGGPAPELAPVLRKLTRVCVGNTVALMRTGQLLKTLPAATAAPAAPAGEEGAGAEGAGAEGKDGAGAAASAEGAERAKAPAAAPVKVELDYSDRMMFPVIACKAKE